jgi:hypothetical protein
MKEEDVSVLSFEDITNEKSNKSSHQHVHPEPIDPGLIERIEFQALCFPFDVCNAPSIDADGSVEVFTQVPQNEAVSGEHSQSVGNHVYFEKQRMILKRERIRLLRTNDNQFERKLEGEHYQLFIPERTKHLPPQVCESHDDSISMQFLECQKLPSNVDKSFKENEENIKQPKRMGMWSFPLIAGAEWKTKIGKRRFGFILLSIVAVTSFIVLLLTLSTKAKGNKRAEPDLKNTLSCKHTTNIFPECSCQDSLSSPMSESVISDHTLMTKLLSRNGVIKNASLYTTSPLSCTPENQAILWISHLNVNQQDMREVLQKYLLAVTYQLLNGQYWMRNSRWLSPESVCDWEGVVCSKPLHHIIEMNMVNNSLSGTLPNNELKFLTSLRKLRMDHNPNLTGALSSELTVSPTLHTMTLSSTSISGTIPSRFGNNVTEILISSTSLKGSLPTELGLLSSLRKLDLRKNNIIGTIPTEIGNLPHLEYIDLSNNQLSGTVIKNWKTTYLNSLLLNHNKNLTGQLPEPPSNLLIHVNIAETSLSGMVPKKYCSLKFLDAVILDCLNHTNVRSCPCCRCIKSTAYL